MKTYKQFESDQKKSHFTTSWEADHYRWNNQENKDFWSKLTSLLLKSELETNPNGYISELSDDKQSILVTIANEMLKTDIVK